MSGTDATVLEVHLGTLPAESLLLRGAARVAAQRGAARALRLAAAARRGLDGAAFEQAPDGRPLPHAGHSWSVSHGGAFAAAAVHTGRVGVDVEPFVARSPEVLERIARAEERQLLPPEGALTFAWTAKEAVLKATQLGLSGLRRAQIADRWQPPGEDFPTGLAVDLDGVRWYVALRPLAAPHAGVPGGVLAVTAEGPWTPRLVRARELHSAP